MLLLPVGVNLLPAAVKNDPTARPRSDCKASGGQVEKPRRCRVSGRLCGESVCRPNLYAPCLLFPINKAR